MPFGAQVLEPNRVRFRLWAPSAGEVELCLGVETQESRHVMTTEADG